MLEQPTHERLVQMRLRGLADAWQRQQEDPEVHRLDFDERFGMLVDAEWTHRENARLKRNLRNAKLKMSNASIEDIKYDDGGKLDRKLVRQLATCKWIELRQNIAITGSTGVGKTYLACALAQTACRRGYTVLYRRVSRLFDELLLAHADGSFPSLLAKLAKADVLILDDWGLAQVGPAERRDLNEIMDDRYDQRSTIITSQLPTETWHDYIGDPTSADAICDRILSKVHRIKLGGRSRRPNQEDSTD